ncbi:hypothetical protein GP2_108_00020 [Gordonia paraffinivorans NBRC 108238]|uniref:Transposase n=1 Tax=Gordonia paraffinivorans NBRC 108238 TaxID=1223543 RepID=A0ABQ0IS13_9ACTN|nr:hypothetical protein GP2_108_00020 [Gordonia paraffinivorans NBRC 108238]
MSRSSRIWTETASGATTARPQLDDLFSHLRPWDTLVAEADAALFEVGDDLKQMWQ